MNCHETRQHLMLYLDSEGDPELHLRVNDHLGVCPACAEWFSKQGRLESLLAEKLAAAPHTPELWDRVLGRSGLAHPAGSTRTSLWLSAVAAGVAVAVVLWRLFLPPTAGPDLARLSGEWHQKLAAGEVAVEFRSESDLDVERYLRRRVAFPVRCPPRKDAGFAVRGAGVCTLADQPAAYLLGRVDGAPVSIFVLPRQGLAAFPHLEEAVRQAKTHHCREGEYAMVLGVIDRNAVLVIGRAAPARLEQVLTAYGTYPEHH